ncbi:MAG: tetratricopeptide repeat protein [Clostridiales bacterium]|nr:tetratricopeptide repeat protein [Clostridiales bacterium]
MICYRCGMDVGKKETCPSCGADLHVFFKVIRISDAYYNCGLAQAQVHNLSGAIESLKRSLKFNKRNIPARNLLGLVYYEIGETVSALSEWVLSESYQPDGNDANRYLEDAQRNRNQLAAINQTIKKFNQALYYCRQDSRDLAVIQLKKVLSMNPRLVKAHQLLALLYIEEDKLDLAKKTLRSAQKIDTDNTLTLRYIKEVNARLKEGAPEKKKKNDDLISYQSGNETIIMPKRFKESSLGSTVLSVVIGLAVGVLVSAFLIVPSVRSQANEEAQQKLIEASDTVSSSAQTIKDLQDQIDDLQTQLEEKEQEEAEVDTAQIDAYEDMLDAYSAYASGDIISAGAQIDSIDTSYLSARAKSIYNSMKEVVDEQYIEALYDEGYAFYADGDYESAVIDLQKVEDYDMDYAAGNGAYYLAQSYRRGGDLDSAREYYQYVLDNYPGTERAKTAKNYVNAQE